MVGVWRIIEEEDQQQSFTDVLERRALKVVEDTQRGKWDDASPVAILERDIALAMAQIEGLRDQQQRLRQTLREAECYIDTELMQMELRTPRYSPYRYPEREKLQRRLQQIQRDEMHFAVRESAELRELHGRLLYLINEHGHLRRRWTSKDSPGN